MMTLLISSKIYNLNVIFFVILNFICLREPENLLEKFEICYESKVLRFSNPPENIWNNLAYNVKFCDFEKNLNLVPLDNWDETKWIVFPKNSNFENNFTLVTLGIANDISAEEKLRDLLPQTQFFGADPTNMSKIYTKIGEHFQFGVSAETGLKSTRIFSETRNNSRFSTTSFETPERNVNFVEFIDDYVQRKLVHFLWIDIEGGEFELFEMLYRNGDIDTNHIDICQINLEIHQKLLANITNEAEKFANFLRKIVEDGKYIIAKPFNFSVLNFIRLFLVNVEDPECRRLFID
ncbi:unnamed protein product [Caenorhabditis angaria]|uniref:Methyltransferase FkbM domain-containing protein n=1 Tax=Caenorhabditis angaria TaxID=860376 RepID=A0A9P1MWW9_9PELO|nr:unnamed protein product [Caenorhabditis angaria]